MALIVCPYCNTRNRAIAKFCIECINMLPNAPTERGFASTMGASTLLALGPIASPGAPSDHSRGMWLSIAALVVALLLGVAGWLLAETEGWYFYPAGTAQHLAAPAARPIRTAAH
ncbi:MAG TPA: hypothetical protein VGI11_13640 [Variovorax sp.]